jgi:hypothetical protein
MITSAAEIHLDKQTAAKYSRPRCWQRVGFPNRPIISVIHSDKQTECHRHATLGGASRSRTRQYRPASVHGGYSVWDDRGQSAPLLLLQNVAFVPPKSLQESVEPWLGHMAAIGHLVRPMEKSGLLKRSLVLDRS